MAGPRMMAIPFAFDSLGRVSFIEDPIEQMRQKVLLVLSTQVGQRCMNPRYGINQAAYLFGFNDAASAGMLQTEIRNALGQWLPTVELINVRLNPLDSGDDPALMSVEVDYAIPTTTSTDPTVYTAVIEIGGTVVNV